MKFTTISAVFCLAAACFAGNSFNLTFAAKKLAPVARSKTVLGKATITDANFIAAPGKKFAFVLTDKNAAEKKFPYFSAAVNFPFAAGSAEGTFKIINREPRSQVRLFHVFAPAASKNDNDLLIYYMFVATNGDGRMGIQIGKKQFLINIPAKSFKADTYNTFKMTWNATTVAAYLNGKKVTERALPPQFTQIAAKKKGWATIAITPVYNGTGDNWKNRLALSMLDIKPAK